LRKRGAQGTRSSAINAFGMHLNMALEPTEGQQAQERAVRIAVAFACVEPWLRRGMGLDLLRRASPFVDPYPTGWLRVASEWAMAGEWPDLETFVAVYGEWNHTRNRGLDLWPLLGWFDRAMADAALGEPVKNARPAFHYRLPDSRIELVDWNIGAEIARWDRIEALADRPEDLAEAAAVCHAMLEGDLPRAEYDARIAGLIT
jgi:hypothetical protein